MNRSLALFFVGVLSCLAMLPDHAAARGFGGSPGMFSSTPSRVSGSSRSFNIQSPRSRMGSPAAGNLGQPVRGGSFQSNSYQGGVYNSGFKASGMQGPGFRVDDFGGSALDRGVHGGDFQSDSYQGGIHSEGFQSGSIRAGNRVFRLPTDAGLHAASRPSVETRRPTDSPGRSDLHVEPGVHGPLVPRGSLEMRSPAPVAPAIGRQRAVAVRSAFERHDVFTPAWYAAHSAAWRVATVSEAAWDVATWDAVNDWFGTAWGPNYYDYGNTIVFSNGEIRFNGQPVAKAADYAAAAVKLATTAEEPQGENQPWLPLGVFAVSAGEEETAVAVLQLAVNKAGALRGTYVPVAGKNDTAATDEGVHPVEGRVNKQTQRAAWSVGDERTTVMDTGLFNLTQDETPVWVHFGTDRTEQWLLVRMQQKTQAEDASAKEEAAP